MADEQLELDENRPIKVVFASDDDYKETDIKGRDFEALCKVTPQLRRQISSKIEAVATQFAGSFKDQPGLPAVAKVQLKEQAQAKSFRPSLLFNEKSCPVIGVDQAGVLLVSVSPPGLAVLQSRISNDGKKNTAHISTIDDIKPYTFDDACKVKITNRAPSKGKVGFRLFRHGVPSQDERIEGAFLELARACGLNELQTVRYTESMTVFVGDNVTAAAIQTLSRFVGTQSVGEIADCGLVRQQSIFHRSAVAADLPAPLASARYGTVGLLDSGTDPNNQHLQSWVSIRDDYWVPAADQDNTHASFVAGLLINARGLNNDDGRFPSVSSKIVDVIVVPKGGVIKETDLIERIDYAINKYPEVLVWNLSIAILGHERNLGVMSDLGAALDERSRKHGVLFVVPTGNMKSIPLRHWPPQKQFGKSDLMPPPGDSLRSLTIGGLAHADSKTTCVRNGYVSPFSRRGPGFGCTIKPDLTHFAGNSCDKGTYNRTGILSVDGLNVVEDIGVSYAVPCVATIAANVASDLQVRKDSVTPTLLKALMVHSAFIHGPSATPDTVEYTGMGRCRDMDEILKCTKSSATIIFQVPVKRYPEFFKNPFPMPQCLNKAGSLQGEVFMTLAYDPPVDKNYTIEYVRVDITASLGTMRIDPETGKDVYHGELPQVPKKLRGRYASSLVKLGLDWSPMKFYWRRFKQLDPSLKWRLQLDRTDRAEWTDLTPQNVYLLVTIRDITGSNVDVYGEMVSSMRSLSWNIQNLPLRSRARGRGRV